MILETEDNKIRKSFSGAAPRYNRLNGLHRQIGGDLIKKIAGSRRCRAILDVGMGTGWMVKGLRVSWPDACVTGLDFADGMVKMARKDHEDLPIVQADARRLPFKEQTFDMVVSNLVYQWVRDLPEAFSFSRRVLRDGGAFYFTLFGQDTFRELFSCLEYSRKRYNRAGDFLSRRLAARGQVEESLLRAGFRDVEVYSECLKLYFPSMVLLMKWAKDIGANTLGSGMYWGKGTIVSAGEHYQQYYRDRFGIFATFEIIWARAQK